VSHFATSLVSPITQFQILPAAIIEATWNRKATGGNVVNPEAGALDKMIARSAYVATTLVPASLRWLGKSGDIIAGEDKRGNPVSAVNEVARGILPTWRREIHGDVAARAHFFALKERFQGASQLLRSEMYTKTTPERLARAERLSAERYMDANIDLVHKIRGLMRTRNADGSKVTKAQIQKSAYQMGLPGSAVENAFKGKVVPYVPNKQTLNRAKEVNKQDIKRYLSVFNQKPILLE
jgi:hypothetical protein